MSDKKIKDDFSNRLKRFSMEYLAHHPVCGKFDNHVFRLGSLILCVGCTSVIIGFIVQTVVFFSLIGVYKTYPLIAGLTAVYGVLLALIQVFLKPKNKWVKTFFRFSLGIGLSGYTSIIILTSGLSYLIGHYTILVQIVLFLLLLPGVFLYNILRGDSPYLECQECEDKYTKPTCDYNFILDETKYNQ